MAEPERAQLHRAVDEVVVWLTEGTETLRQRTAVGARRDRAVAALESRITTVASGSRTWQILPLGPHDDATLADLAAFDAMSTLSTQHAVLFEELTTAVAADLPAARAAASWRGRVQRRLVGSANTAAARRVLDFHARALAAGLPAVIRSARPGALDGTDALDLGSHVPAVRGRVSVIPAAALGPVTSAAQGSDAAQFASPSPVTSAARAAGTALEQAEQHRARLAEDVHAVREATVRPALDALPLERLAEQADGVLRRAPLEEAGLRSVGDVYAARRELVRLPGVSPRLAHRAAAAAEAWFAEVATSQRVLDVHALHPPSRAHARVAERLSEGQPLRSVARRREHLETIRGLLPLGRALDEGATRLLVSGDAEHAAALRQHLEALVATGLHLRDSLDRPAATGPDATGPDAPGSAVPESGWSAVVDRPGLYAALAREAGVDQSPPDLPDHGLPDHLAARIRQHPLRPPAAGAPVQLLAHQEVAARFFLAQRRMVLADEPGLDPVPGVVAALAHLDAVFDARPSRRRILLTTAPERLARWRRRVEAVGLDVFVLGASAAAQDSAASSGSEPPPVHDAVTGWAQHGGVLLASHEDLPVLDEHRGQLIGPAAVDTVVLDDAHHLTDDAALDAAARQWASAARRVLALTTAPIENPGSPGRAVLELVDGEGAGRAQELTGARWWIAVAPRVLHRTRAEVLDQVPTRVVTTHEVPFSPADAAAYRAAVDDGTFLRLRQAAFHPGDSAKLELLMRLVQEATLHGERVMVVSAFREVLDTVAAAITARGLRASPLLVLAPHTSMPRLADPAPPRVSVDRVILCEPRVGHAAEQRALATAQAPRWDHPLLVHRLVSTQGVDQELLRLSREQSAADASLALPPTPEQLSALAREIVARERARLALSAGPVGGDSRTGL